MKLLRSSLPPRISPGPRVVALGSFDGVHLGHQAVLRRTVELAKKHHALSTVLTFDPPPGLFFNHSGKQSLLTTLSQKQRLMGPMGLDEMVVLTFDGSLAALSPLDFASQVLKDGLGASIIVCGPGHRFGAGGAGDCLLLVSAGLSLAAEIVPHINYGGEAISSTHIRELIEDGLLEDAAHCLGRPYSVIGTQVRGEGRGAKLGFPTVNLQWEPLQLLPPTGIYACQARVVPKESPSPAPSAAREAHQEETKPWAAASLGIKPTFGGSSLALELHFLGQPPSFEPGKEWEAFFIRRLRDEVAFKSDEALKEQIALDVALVRKLAETTSGANARILP